MARKGGNRPLVTAAQEVSPSMVSEPGADELTEVGDDPGSGSDRRGSATHLSDDVGLDPKNNSDPRGLAGDGWIPQKDRDLDHRFQTFEEKVNLQVREVVSEAVREVARGIEEGWAIRTREWEDRIMASSDSKLKAMEERMNDRLERMMEVWEINNRISPDRSKGKQVASEGDPIQTGRFSHYSRKEAPHPDQWRRNVEVISGERDLGPARHQRSIAAVGHGCTFSLPKNLKVEMPIFNGTGDVLNWIYQVEHLFSIYRTPPEERVEFCLFYLKEEALSWWRWVYKQRGGRVSWREFCEELKLQYGPSELEDPMGALANLKQTDSVLEYHKAFLKLAHLVDETEKNLVSLFMAGLKEELRGVCTSVLKRICRENGIIRWPYRKFLAGKTFDDIKKEAAREKSKELAGLSNTAKQNLYAPKMMHSMSAGLSTFGNQVQNRAPDHQGVSMAGNALQPQGNKSFQHGWSSTVQTQTKHVPTYFDDFKHGFPSSGLASASTKWWGTSSVESDEKLDSAKPVTNEEEKQNSCKLTNEPSRCMMVDEQTDSNIKDSGSTLEPSASLVSLKKRIVECGRESIQAGLSNCGSYKLGKRKRLLLVQVFGSSLPDQWKNSYS